MAATTTSAFEGMLSPEQAAPIFEKAAEMSTVQRVAQRVELGIHGTSIPVFANELSATWVGEAGKKPASEATPNIVTMEPKKLATIFAVSAEVVRANPGNFMNIMRDKVAAAFARAFDQAALHGHASAFPTYIDQTTQPEVSLEQGTNAYLQLNEGLNELVTDGKELTGFLFDPRTEPILNGAVDTANRPLFIDTPIVDTNPTVRPGRVLGRPAYIGKGVYDGTSVVGYAGDWSKVAWGVVGGISFDVSDQAAVDLGDGALTSLWQHNLIAVRAEAEYGFVVADRDAFVKYTNAPAEPAA